MCRVVAVLAALTALLAVLPGGAALSCYKCSDLLDVDAGDSSAGRFVGGLFKSLGDLTGLPPCSEFSRFESRFRAEDCGVLGNGCVKLVTSGGQVSRSCSPVTQDGCREGDDGGVACSCRTDYCNGAGGPGPALLLLLLPAAAAALLSGRL